MEIWAEVELIYRCSAPAIGRYALLRVRRSIRTTPQVFRLPGRARGPAAAGSTILIFLQFELHSPRPIHLESCQGMFREE